MDRSRVRAPRRFGMLVLAMVAATLVPVGGAAGANDGSVWQWGYFIGPLNYPIGSTPFLTGAKAVAAGSTGGVAAVKADGTVMHWARFQWEPCEDDPSYECGFSTSVVTVPGLRDVVAVAAGDWHFVALRSDGTVWTWGREAGLVGHPVQDGDEFDSYQRYVLGSQCRATADDVPAQVTGLGGIVAISAGDHHTLALDDAGVLWAWGMNWHGELGDGSLFDRDVPVPVLTGVAAMAAGAGQSVAVLDTGAVLAWGLGNPSPTRVDGLRGIREVATGADHVLGLAHDGTVWAWGGNGSGQLGDGTYEDRIQPVQVVGLPGPVKTVAAGAHVSFAVTMAGALWGWGSNGHTNQLGLPDAPPSSDGFIQARTTAVPIRVGAEDAFGGAPIKAISASDGEWLFRDLAKVVAIGDLPNTEPTIAQPCEAKCRAPLLTGAAEPGALVDVYEGARRIGTATTNAAGQWELPAALDNGSHTLEAVAHNAAGVARSAPTSFEVSFAGYRDTEILERVLEDHTGMGEGVADVVRADRSTGALEVRSTVRETLPAGIWHGEEALGSVRALATGNVISEFPVSGCGTFQVALVIADVLAEVTADVPQLGVQFARAAGAEVKALGTFLYYPCPDASCAPTASVTDASVIARLDAPDAPEVVTLKAALPSPRGFTGEGVVRVIGGLHTDALVSGNGIATAHVKGTFLSCLI